MNDKDYDKLVKDYEKLHASNPNLYILDHKEGFDTRSDKVLDKRFLERSEEERIRVLIN